MFAFHKVIMTVGYIFGMFFLQINSILTSRVTPVYFLCKYAFQ
jgi:hypothetical protein